MRYAWTHKLQLSGTTVIPHTVVNVTWVHRELAFYHISQGGGACTKDGQRHPPDSDFSPDTERHKRNGSNARDVGLLVTEHV